MSRNVFLMRRVYNAARSGNCECKNEEFQKKKANIVKRASMKVKEFYRKVASEDTGLPSIVQEILR